MQTMEDYVRLYLQCDVFHLADVCQNFRSMCRDKAYNIEPFHKFTSPGVAFEAALKMTDINLELLSDEGMHLMIERGIRGGLCNAFHRYAVANNPLVPDLYDSEQLRRYLILLDANNLYGYGMIQPLPSHGFRWLSKSEIRNLDYMSISINAKVGYIFEVDFDYSSELHDAHAEFPLAPELIAITKDLLPPHLQHLGQKANNLKLTPTLLNKRRYVVHYRLLQFYFRHGLKVRKIRRVMRFRQSCWLKKYIDFNTKCRMAAITEFAKAFFKLMVSMCVCVYVYATLYVYLSFLNTVFRPA
jgi:hypothetical protein